ncbi:MAG: prolyl oligopeptidase family serine peptidase [Clostridia bacterium]|nr:prolyl oligopeptidase family serine peptidase [Clostridia bacterium]
MEKIITYENLRSFTYTNDKAIKGEIKGIVLSFFGLGGMDMYNDADTLEGDYYAKKGIIYVVPYNNPWAWMNMQAVNYTDEIIDVLFDHYSLPKDTPIVSTGGSMGGQSALVYMAYARRTPVACVANCPVCDVVYHFTERVDLPRTLYSAVSHYDGSLEEGLKSISPLHLIDRLPRSSYHIFHCDTDDLVNIEKHSNTFVKALKGNSFDVTYDIVAKRGHCDLDYDAKIKYNEYIERAIGV